ncbi:N-acetylmuramoyl-L-alanine amidase-like domain-containing protein [Methylacidimicrobium tartarophylax]|uniref:DUF1460 domain-containing protein n=1 Tax=Methylacidimicrobium tartarophylax TaxID=1041768 RepID=A0A5E6MAI4_9BACT|nr:N-acetylmuramoyl-L-alanine amidase-like domain-containing protein [Methylacidimicrobium tartarophylax]VVM06562.1 hypothetical protein MAMT_01272 [Methylacidimicrobium tartarophylax]
MVRRPVLIPLLLLSVTLPGFFDRASGDSHSDSTLRTLPPSIVFRGKPIFTRLVAEAEREGWREMPIGQRTARIGVALVGTPYKNWTLEIDDHIEAPSVDLDEMDCWTFFEISLGFARMLREKTGDYQPDDLLRMIEIDRYRGGRCDGTYYSRLHHLEDWIRDNARRDLVIDLTRRLGGVPMTGHSLHYMGEHWEEFRYLRHNPDLIPRFQALEKKISAQPVYYIPKGRVASIEPRLQNGDIICIASTWPGTFTSHVGLAYRDSGGVLHFLHATSIQAERRVVIGPRLSDYLSSHPKAAGILVARPLDLPQADSLAPRSKSAEKSSKGTRTSPATAPVEDAG